MICWIAFTPAAIEDAILNPALIVLIAIQGCPKVKGDAASALANEWLEIKPQGGRIFVDEKGNATAYRGEDLIYLGKVSFWA